MSKKIISLLLAFTMIISLVGCQNTSESKASEDENKTESQVENKDVSATEKTKLTFWHSMGGTGAEGIDELVSRFNSSQDKIEVEAQYQGEYDDALTKLRSVSAGKDVGADIVQIFDLGTRFMIDSGLIVPVQDYIDKDNYDISQIEPNLAAYYTVDNKLNSMPFNSSTPLLYYNKDIFEKAGIENPPKSLEEILDIGDKIQNVEGVDMTISINIYGWWLEQMMSKQGKNMFNNGNGREENPTEVEFLENNGMEEALKLWKELNQKGYAPNVGRSGDGVEFISGISAMTFASTASLRNILNEVGDRFEVGTAYFPSVKKSDTGQVSIGGASLYMIDSNDDDRKDASWEFIKFMISPESQAYWNAQTGYFPITLKAHEEKVFKDNLAQYPQFETAIDQLHDTDAKYQGGLSTVFQETRQIVEKELEIMLNEDKEPSEIVEQMAEEVNQALEEYNRINN